MSAREDNLGDLEGVISTLQSLRPTRPGIDRDRLLYEAGRRAARGRRGWQVATLLACLTAGATGLAWHWAPAEVREAVVYVPTVSATLMARESAPDPLTAGMYPELRETALRTGGAVPPPEIDLDLPPRPILTAGSYALSKDESRFLPGRTPE